MQPPSRFKRPSSPVGKPACVIACLDPDRSAIAQVYAMRSVDFDAIKDSMARRKLDPDISLRLLPESGCLSYLEPVTYAPWWLHLVTWLPACVAVWLWTLPHTLLTATLILFGFVCVWPLLEYMMHRFFFHASVAWASSLPHPLQGCVNVIRLLSHTVHHAHPTDRKRIITPLPMSLAIAGLVFPVLFFLVRNAVAARALSVGIVLGFVYYDYVHYDLHLGADLGTWPSWIPSFIKEHFRILRRAHRNHHYATNGQQASFGVSEGFWDAVFHTQAKLMPLEEGSTAVK
jgi:hypothetical protein